MFTVYCDNKGCGKDSKPLLNVDTNEAECGACGKAIKSVTSFTKSQMKSLGQIKRDDRSTEAFSVQCKFCLKAAPPKVNDDEEVVCSVCTRPLDHLSTHYKNIIKQQFSKK